MCGGSLNSPGFPPWMGFILPQLSWWEVLAPAGKCTEGCCSVVFCSHVLPFCRGQEFFHNTRSRLEVSAQGAYLACSLRKHFLHGVMEPPWNACQPSTVCLFQVHWKETWLHSSAWPGCMFDTLSAPQPVPVRSVSQPGSSSGLAAWHKHTKPTEPLTEPRCSSLCEHARVDNCWERRVPDNERILCGSMSSLPMRGGSSLSQSRTKVFSSALYCLSQSWLVQLGSGPQLILLSPPWAIPPGSAGVTRTMGKLRLLCRRILAL